MGSDKKKITELLSVNRRNFIKFAIGGAVGTGLSPLPWKLIDDTAIFTQNLPWVPIPETGKFTKVKSHCTLCPGACGIEVRKVGDRAVKIEGRTDHPVNPGGLCPLGMGGLQLLYNENIRCKSPLKRVGARGTGEFEPLSWDEALSILTHHILELRSNGKASSIVAIDDYNSGSTVSLLIKRFMKTIGSNNYMRLPSAEGDMAAVSKLMYGSDTPVAYDLENSDFILSFGCGLLDGWGAPGRILNAWGLWRSAENRGVTIYQVEPRASNTASKADKWIPAIPGTETALALGIANVIIRENLYNKGFIENRTYGFFEHETEGIKQRGFRDTIVENYNPDRVSEITGIAPEMIISTARMFARAKAPLAICGKGKGILNGDINEFMAVHALNALTGNINRPGGVLTGARPPLGILPDPEIDEIASESLKNPGMARANGVLKEYSSQTSALTENILKENGQEVDTLLVFSSNPAFTLPDGGDFYKALKKVPFTVSFSPFLDETAMMADLILPDHTYLEKIDDTECPSLQYSFFGMTQPVVTPLYDTRNTGDVIINLAEMIGGSTANSFPFKGLEEAIKTRAQGLFDSGEGTGKYNPSDTPWKIISTGTIITTDFKDFKEMWRHLRNGGFWYNPLSHIKADTGLFAEPESKFEFVSRRLKSLVEAYPEKSTPDVSEKALYMPHYRGLEKSDETYPLMMAPYEMINLTSGWLPNPPYLNKTLFDSQLKGDDSFVEINPETALVYKLKEGDKIQVTSVKGSVNVRVHLFDGAMPGVVFMPMGFGHMAYDDFSFGKGCNPNTLMGAEKDRLSNQPAWWYTPVKISKVV
ncbi:MAG: molybdopterin-dependent oxidoreductase [Desulfatiglans sp.]|jgi:anaerobic selenocysteine-containing dehydrogenase|nr:molybdopterin-dependent oxidoreductase [Desulfatiglans sp.]